MLRLVLTAFVLASVWGCLPPQTTTADPPAPPQPDAGLPVQPRPDASSPFHLTGRWGMRGEYAEGIAADLQQDGAVLTGFLCANGLPNTQTPSFLVAQYCGAIADGHVDGNRIRFGTTIQSGLTHLVVDAVVSSDSSRMQGRFFEGAAAPTGPDDSSWNELPGGWQRLSPGHDPIRPDSDWFEWPGLPEDVAPSCRGDGGYDLTLIDATPGATEFTSARTYELLFCGGVVSQLGVFGGDDLRFTLGPDGKTTTIEAGPVPDTVPGLATSATLHLEAGAVTRVEATTAGGASYSFTAASRSRGP